MPVAGMNGIAPFWSAKSLVAFLVAPVSPGVVMGLLVLVLAQFAAVEGSLSTILFSAVLSIAGAALVGYPIAILTAAPLYYFVLGRMARVGYRHFLYYGAVLAVTFNVVMPLGLWSQIPGHGGFFNFALGGLIFAISTVLACSVFYFIVRQPEMRNA